MIKYDGHICFHELFNHKGNTTEDTCDWLWNELPKHEEIEIELTFYTLAYFHIHLHFLELEQPHIKTIHVKQTNREHLNPRYALQKDIDKFINTLNDNSYHNIVIDDIDLTHHTSMDIDTLHKIINEYKDFAWRIYDLNTYIIDEPDTYSMLLFDPLKEYFSDISWTTIEQLIKDNLKDGPQ